MKYLKFLSESTNYTQIRLSFGHFCNQKCVYCYNKFNYGKKFLEKSDIDLFFKKIHESNLKNIFIHLLGGEPTVNPNLRYFEELCDKDVTIKEVRVYSNLKKHVDFFSDKITLNPSFHYKANFDHFLKELIYHRERIKRISLMDFAQKDRIQRLLEILKDYPDLLEVSEICPVFFKEYQGVNYDHPDTNKEFEYFNGEKAILISHKDIVDSKMSFKGWRCDTNTYDIGCDLGVQTACFNLGNLHDKDFRFKTFDFYCSKELCSELYKLQIYKELK